MRFQRYIGIDYSGAQTPESRLKALQVYAASGNEGPVKVSTPTAGAKNWTRLEVAQYCQKALESGEPVIIGIDHGYYGYGRCRGLVRMFTSGPSMALRFQ